MKVTKKATAMRTSNQSQIPRLRNFAGSDMILVFAFVLLGSALSRNAYHDSGILLGRAHAWFMAVQFIFLAVGPVVSKKFVTASFATYWVAISILGTLMN